jgi:hypothetical protein
MLACDYGRKKGIMKEFALDILRQLFGLSQPREGKLILTRNCLSRMTEYGLDEATIKNVFRFGKEEKPGMIIQKFYEYSIGIYYRYEEGKYMITTCWKGGV